MTKHTNQATTDLEMLRAVIGRIDPSALGHDDTLALLELVQRCYEAKGIR